jgi:hypothetical protein
MKTVPKTIYEDLKFINIWAVSIQSRCIEIWDSPKFKNEIKPLLDDFLLCMENIQYETEHGQLTEAHISEIKLLKAEIDFALS